MALLPKSLLKPDTSVMLGLANGGVILGIYSMYLPPSASVRTVDPHDNDIEKSRRAAAWTSAGVLGLMYLMTRDKNSFMIGGMVLGAVDFTVKHANGLNPFTNKLDTPEREVLESGMADTYNMPDYAADAGEAAYG